MSKRSQNVLLAVTSLIFGGMIYLVLRPNTQISKLFQSFSINISLQTPKDSCVFTFLEYYFVDFLWCFSLCCSLVAVFLPRKRGVMTCSAIGVAWGILWEMLQYIGIANGTGDIFDIIAYLLAGIICILANKKFKGEEK